MSEEGQTWYNVLINDEKLSELFVPDHISKRFRRYFKIVRLYRGDNKRIYHVKWVKIREESGIEIYFKDGWSNFVKDNDIMLGDILELLYMGDGAFKVHIWPGGQYIHDYVEISSDSLEDIEQIENDAEKEEDAEIEEATHNDAEMEEASHSDAGLEEDSLSLPNDRCSWIPNFEVRYTGPYSAMGRMNVPLKFARIHFSLFGYENPAEIWDGNNKMWKAKLFVKRDSNGKIVLCNIREGVKELMHGVQVMAGKKVIVQLVRKNPLALKVSIK